MKRSNSIVIFVSNKKNFFKTRHCLNCGVSEYAACDDIDVLFNVDKVTKSQLLDVGEGIKMSRPFVVNHNFRRVGIDFFVSISHNGIVAINSFTGSYDEYEYEPGDGRNIVQFSNLKNNIVIELETEDNSLVGFYDDSLVILTNYKPLRGCKVKDIFDCPSTTSLTQMCEVNNVFCATDVSVMNSTRMLYYTTMGEASFEYNVDTKSNYKLRGVRIIWSFASLTGIMTNSRAVFQEWGENELIYALGRDYGMRKIHDFKQGNLITAVIPSSSNPSNLQNAGKKYEKSLFSHNRTLVDISELLTIDDFYSVVRLYHDVFFAFDNKKHKWVLTRIVVV